MAVVAMVAVVLGVLAGPLGPANAQSDLDLTVVVTDGDELTVSLDAGDVLVGSIEGSVVYSEQSIDQTTCVILDGVGACNDIGGEVLFATLSVTGWTGEISLVTVGFEGIDGTQPVEVLIRRAIHDDGSELSRPSTTVRIGTAPSFAVMWIGGAVTVVFAAGLWFWRRSRSATQVAAAERT